MNKLIVLSVLTMMSASAMAGSPNGLPTVTVPEPGMLGLFATATVALLLLKKFKK